MKYPCQYSDNCYYDGIIDTDKQSYGMKSIQGREYFWHYRCSEGNIRIPVFLTSRQHGALKDHLRFAFRDIKQKPAFVVSILEKD